MCHGGLEDHHRLPELFGAFEAVDKVDIRPLCRGPSARCISPTARWVKKGDPLFTIDPRPYVAAVDQPRRNRGGPGAQRLYID